MLYIPPFWWHYVRALTPSFSVSFWWGAEEEEEEKEEEEAAAAAAEA
jgi:ribosomal protein L16 Arg81 hydroxylase